MSAIAGEVSFNSRLQPRLEEFEEMKKSLIRRGPDDEASYISDNVALIQNLLTVSNETVEPLPYCTKISDKKYMIVLDGKLSNSDEMRKRLEINVTNDYELIIAGYDRFGEKIAEYLNGVYAFALWDFSEKQLFFVRDRLGVKPFFYSLVNGNFIFASEIKGLLKNNEISPVIDIGSICEIMLLGPGRTLGCGVFKGISELKPGFCGSFGKNGLQLRSYWSLKAKEHKDSFEDTVETVRELVKSSVEKQISGDYPVCSMLSGGLDSSIITAVADRFLSQGSEKLKTFSVTYADNDRYFKKNRFQPESDSAYIELMKEQFNIDNELITLDSDDLYSALFSAVDARDLPGMADVDSSLLLFCKSIRQQYKIAVSGECSDELFGGYPWYRDPELDNPKGFPWSHSDSIRKGLIRDDVQSLTNPDEYVYSRYIATVKSADKLKHPDKDERKKELMKLNLDWFMMTLVDRTDRMSSYCSLDVRVPFCDYKTAEYLYNVPWEIKDYKGYEKGLLREAFRDYLPEKVLFRKKSPYPKTYNPEYMKMVRKSLNELIDEGTSPMFGFVKKEALRDIIEKEMKSNFYGQLMTSAQTAAYFLQIDYWLKKYNIKVEL